MDYYEARFRNYDPEIGRFTQIDPKVESAEGWSVYSGMLDDPVLNSDPLGDSSIVGNWLDSRGWGFRKPTSEQWENHPFQSAVSEAGYAFADFFGLTTAENTARTLSDPNVSATDKVVSVAGLGLSMNIGEHGLKEPVVEKPVDKVEVKAAEQLPKPLKGKGSVPPSERDPKRVFTKEEKAKRLDKQNGKCAQCGEKKTIDEVDGHHLRRHADGGGTTTQNGAALCKDFHIKLHQ